MTSTVLDVTVMLLCVSASVVALGGVGSDPFGTADGAPDVERTADRLTTETATVTYDVPEGDETSDDAAGSGETSTVHATLAELIVMSAWGGDTGSPAADAFTSEVRAVVTHAFGPRTRIDARPKTGGSTVDRDAIAIGAAPPRAASVTTAVATVPVPESVPSEYDRIEFVVRVW